MMKIYTQKTLPVTAVLRGEQEEGNQVVLHDKAFEGSRTWTYKHCRSQVEFESVVAHPALRGFRDFNNYINTWEEVLVQYQASDIVAAPKPRKVLLIHNNRHDCSEFENDELWGIAKKDFGYHHFFPVPDMPRLKYDYPSIKEGQFDVVVIDYLNSDIYNETGLREYAEDALRIGGVLKIKCPASRLSNWTRQLATRFERCVIDTDTGWLFGERDQRYIDQKSVRFFGIKKGVRKYDPAEEKYLSSVLNHEHEEKRVGTKQYMQPVTPYNPKTYPPTVMTSLRVEKHYDDTPLLSEETLTVKVAPRQETEIADLQYILGEALKPFGDVKMAWGSRYGGYDIEMDNPKLLPELRKLVEGKNWEIHIKGQKAITSVTLETQMYEPFLAAPGLAPHLLPKYIDTNFAEDWFCNSMPLPADEVVTDEKQLLFPVAPSLANLMKLFGQLKPSVIQGKDEIYYLASGTVRTETLTQEIVDDKGREVTVENTKKRAKLVTFALTGDDPGQQYEAEMG